MSSQAPNENLIELSRYDNRRVARTERTAPRPADVLLFTGVRYERIEEPAALAREA